MNGAPFGGPSNSEQTTSWPIMPCRWSHALVLATNRVTTGGCERRPPAFDSAKLATCPARGDERARRVQGQRCAVVLGGEKGATTEKPSSQGIVWPRRKLAHAAIVMITRKRRLKKERGRQAGKEKTWASTTTYVSDNRASNFPSADSAPSENLFLGNTVRDGSIFGLRCLTYTLQSRFLSCGLGQPGHRARQKWHVLTASGEASFPLTDLHKHQKDKYTKTISFEVN